MSVSGLKLGFTVKYGKSPQDCPRAVPLGNPSGPGQILPYIPPLVLLRIQYSSQGVYGSLTITKNDNIVFELFSIACSIGQYFLVFTKLRWVNTKNFSICPAEVGKYWKK